MSATKIGFVLLSNTRNPQPSTRIAVLNMLPFLRAANFEPHILFEPGKPTEMPDLPSLADKIISAGIQLVYFQKVRGASVECLVKQVTEAGIKTVYGVCDYIDTNLVNLSSASTVTTDYLQKLHPQELWPKIHKVHDGIEHPEYIKTEWNQNSGSPNRPLRAVLVTSAKLDRLPVLVKPPAWLDVSIVGSYPPSDKMLQRFNDTRWTFARKSIKEQIRYAKFLADRRIHRVAWDRVGMYKSLLDADLGIIPIEGEDAEGMPFALEDQYWRMKSENRLTMKMCIGLPVIATPIPAYETVIQQGGNGFLAETYRQWMAYLDVLRDPSVRQSIGHAARQSVVERYSMQRQAECLIGLFRSLLQ